MTTASLRAYVPDLAAQWLREDPEALHRRVEGTMAFLDISGFTSLTERLTRLGTIGSEELSDILSSTFAALLEQGRGEGADLVKWGGDAVLLLFHGPHHAVRAARAATAMRRALYSVGRVRSSAGEVTLRMSVGMHSGSFDFFLVGDPAIHRELLVSGPAASRTAQLEAAASPGQIAISPQTASFLPRYAVAADAGGLLLVRRTPTLATGLTQAGPEAATSAPGADSVDEPDVTMLLPPPVRAHLLAEAGEAEHRIIAVAFLQFSGTDELLTRHGPRAVAAGLDDLVRRTQAACARHGVTFLESDINTDGGKIMLVCGAPAQSEHVEDRMVRAVREVVEDGHLLPVRAGINAGRVFSADFGPQFRRTYSVKGDAINVAARVMSRARPGQVLATRAVLARARPGIISQEVPPFLVKGKSRPLNASLVLSTPADWEGAELPGGTEVVVGRDEELRTLAAALEEVWGARVTLDGAAAGQSIEVLGPAGVGKTTLVHALCDRLGPDITVVHGPSGRYGGSVAHQAVRRLLRDLLGVHPTATKANQLASLHTLLTTCAPQLSPWLPVLAGLLEVSVPDTPQIADLDVRFRPAKVAEVFAEFVVAALPGPTLLVLESVDTMDDASAQILDRLALEVARRPWVMLTTRRTTKGGLHPAGPVRSIWLGPLDLEASVRALDAWSQERPVSEQVLRSVAVKAGGNPLFLRSLLELARRSGALDDLPDDVEEVIGAEIEELAPRPRTILRFASVLGERFGLDSLRELIAPEGWVITAQDLDAVRAQLAVQDTYGHWYAFRSSLVRDVAYAGMPHRLRRRLHLRAGEALQRSAPGDPSASESLSTHFFEAGDHSRALLHSRAAAEQARASYSYVEARRLYQRAIACAARSPGVPPREVGDLHEAIGDVADLVGQSSAAIAEYRRARPWFGQDPLARCRVMAKEVAVHQRIGQLDTSLRIAAYARRVLARSMPGQGAPDPGADHEVTAILSRLAVQLAFVHHLRSRHEQAMHWSSTAVTEGRRSGDSAVLARAYNCHALVLAVAGIEPDRPYGELALAKSEESGDLLLQGKCLTNQAISAIIDGRWPTVEGLLGRALDVIERVGDTGNLANVRYNLCDVLVRQGRWEDVEPLLALVSRSAQATGDIELVALAREELGIVRLGQGRVAEAVAHLRAAQAQLAELGLVRDVATTQVALLSCRVVLAGAAPDPALEVAQVGSALSSALDGRGGEHVGRLHFLHGTLLLAAGQPERARTAYLAGSAAYPGEGGLDRALNLLGVAAAGEAVGSPCPQVREDALATLTRLGVRALPIPMPCSPLR